MVELCLQGRGFIRCDCFPCVRFLAVASMVHAPVRLHLARLLPVRMIPSGASGRCSRCESLRCVRFHCGCFHFECFQRYGFLGEGFPRVASCVLLLSGASKV